MTESLLSPKKKTTVTKVIKPEYLTFEDYPPEDLFLYAGVDCLVTSRLAATLLPRMVDKPKYRVFEGGSGSSTILELPSNMEVYQEYTAPAFEFIVDMEINGIRYDVEKNLEINAKMIAEISQLDEKIFSAIGRTLNLDSDLDLIQLLYVEKGYEVTRRTKSGEPSTDGEAILGLAKETGESWLYDLAKRGDIASTWRTFIRDYLKFVKSDGRIHPSYNLHGTSGYRISGEEPNLTQLPRPKHGYNIRECFCVDSGNVFLTLDFSSAEVKVLGALCQEPNLVKAILEGLDFHSFSASQMHGIDYQEFIQVLADSSHPLYREYKEKRQAAKVLTFSLIYGSTPAGIAFQLGISVEEAEHLMSLYFKLYPGIETFVQDSHNMAKANAYTVTALGYRKMQYGTLPPFKNTAAFNGCLRNSNNVRVQSAASGVGLFAFGEINRRIKSLGGRVLCTVYDSVEIEVPRPRVAEALEISYYCMDDLPQEKFKWLTFPIGTDAEVGFNWGNLKHVHRGMTQDQIEEILNELSN